VALDSSYLYFRYRVNGDPSGPKGFADFSDWVMLLQVPSGNPLQYQYQLALNGEGQGGDTVEVWQNTTPENLAFSPLFTDEPDVRLFRQVYDFSGPSTVNTTPLARSLPVAGLADATDWFVDVAFPVSVLVANGLSAADLPGALFYPATATHPERHNRDHLECRFLPEATLRVDAAVAPGLAPPNATTRVGYTFAVHDTGTVDASGLVLTGSSLPPYLFNVSATVSVDAPDVTATLVSTSPLEVRVPRLPTGRTLTVRIDADAAPTCADASAAMDVAAVATNAGAVSGTAALDTSPGAEVCDGVDNNCDGRIDAGGAALCDDRDGCTTDTCDPQTGCAHAPIPSCTPCTTVAECNDQDGCTTDGCNAGRCTHTPLTRCVACTTAAECADTDPCTDDLCGPENVCLNSARAGCSKSRNTRFWFSRAMPMPLS